MHEILAKLIKRLRHKSYGEHENMTYVRTYKNYANEELKNLHHG